MDYKILDSKNCFITGATGGIGKAIACQLAAHKCNLFLTSTKADRLRNLRQVLEGKFGVKVLYKSGDLRKVKDIEDIIASIRNSMGTIDVLVNCAGNFIVKSLADSNLDDFTSTFDLIVRSTFIFSKEFSQDMKKNGWGRIVNIGSSSVYSGIKNTILYCAAKHALLGLSRSLHDELKKYNVRTFLISPSGTKTKMGKLIQNQDYDTFLEPEEIADYVSFVISYNGSMVSEEIRLNRLIQK